MPGNHKLAGTTLIPLLLITGLLFDTMPVFAQAQHPAFYGTFVLPYQVHWGRSVLRPGKYSVTIRSTGSPMIALIRTANGDAATFIVNHAVSKSTNGENSLLLREKDGKMIVYSLNLSSVGVALIYDPSLAQEAIKEARAGNAVPLLSVKK